MESLIFDTTFLIDFQRERRKGGGPAHEFLRNRADHFANISVVTYGEFAEGFRDLSNPVLLSIVDSFEVLPVDADVAKNYARISGGLRSKGLLIGTNDLWIAATALSRDYDLVTRNSEHFNRVRGLRVRSY